MSRLRNLIDPAPSRVKEHPLRVGLIIIAVAFLVVYMATAHNIPLINGKPGYAVEAEFAAANQVTDRTPIRVQGVDVGTVEKVEAGADPRRASKVTLRITDEDVKLHSDARAAIRWRTLLGGSMYVDLEPGSPRAPELDGVIPVSRTSNQVELDDALRVYEGNTEQAQRDVLKGLAGGFAAPDSAGAAIAALPKLDTVRRGAKPIRGSETDDLRKLVASTATTVDALGADVGALNGLITGARRTLGATSQERANLGGFLERSPATLDDTERTIVRLRTTLGHLDPLVRELRPGARKIKATTDAAKPALRETDLLLRQVRPVLRDAQPTFRDLSALSASGIPLIKGLEPTTDRLNADTLPFLNSRDDRTRLRLFESVGPTFSVLDKGAAEYDAEGFRLHLSTLLATNSVITLATEQAMTRSCRLTATPAQDGQCPDIAEALTIGLQGGRKK